MKSEESQIGCQKGESQFANVYPNPSSVGSCGQSHDPRNSSLFTLHSSLFTIRKEERKPAAVVAIFFTVVNALMVANYAHLFMWGDKDSWKDFMKHFVVSGFDPITYSVMTEWSAGYNVYRHPLLAFFVWPFSQLNQGILKLTGLNMVQVIVALLLVLAAIYTFIFLYRIARELIGLARQDALLLSAYCFSFGYVMLSFAVPDHFAFSMMLLVMALYISGKCIQKGLQLGFVQTVLLFVFTAGVSLNNGLKIFMDALFVNGRRFFRPKYMLLAVVLPAALMWGFARWEYRTFVWPKEMARKELAKNANERQRQQVIKAFRDSTKLKDTAAIRVGYESILAQRDSMRAARKARRAVNRHSGKPMMEGEFMRWTDVTTPRWPSLVENVFGESIQMHEDYLLGDTLRSRPVIVKYNYWLNYIVEAIIVLLFIAGIWKGRRKRFLWMALAGMALDIFLHVGLGFGLNEVYIMTAHWIFVVPIATGYLLRVESLPPFPPPEGESNRKPPLGEVWWGYRITLLVLTVFLVCWNIALYVQYLIL